MGSRFLPNPRSTGSETETSASNGRVAGMISGRGQCNAATLVKIIKKSERKWDTRLYEYSRARLLVNRGPFLEIGSPARGIRRICPVRRGGRGLYSMQICARWDMVDEEQGRGRGR